MNKNDVFYKIGNNLKIMRSIHEEEKGYFCRIVYSALSIHIRTSTLDIDFPSENVGRSKKYIKEKCDKILKSFIEIYPSLKEWFYENEENPIKLIRDRLQFVGELINIGFNNSIIVASDDKCLITSNCKVLRGLNFEKINNISGLILIEKSIKEEVYREDIEKFYNYDVKTNEIKMMMYLNSNMEKVDSMEKVEIFNKYLKKTPSQSWTSEFILNEGDLTIYRSNYKDYGFIKKYNNKLYKKPINKYDIDDEEIRRYIFYLKAQCNNKIPYYVDFRDHNYVYLSLSAQLPKEENNILYALGWPMDNIRSRKFIFKKEVWDYIEIILNDLHLRRVEKFGKV